MENVKFAWQFARGFLKLCGIALISQFAFNHKRFVKFWDEFGLVGLLEVGAGLFLVFCVYLLGNFLWCMLLLKLQEKRRREGWVPETRGQRWHRYGRALGAKLSRQKLRIE